LTDRAPTSPSSSSSDSVATPAVLGFRMPAEWHRHEATWFTWPKDPITWPDRVPQVREIFLRMIEVLAEHEIVNLLVDDDEAAADVRRRMTASPVGPQAKNVRLHIIPTVDSWIRDYGPNFVVHDDGRVAFNDFGFNAWGGKYETLKADSRVPKLLEPIIGLPRFACEGVVLEGGSIDVNGAGVVMTTEQCLLNVNRNPGMNRAEIERVLCDYLGARNVLWLGEGVAGDDTDGHIDDIARFTDASTIVCAMEEDPADVNHHILADNVRRLELARDANGRPYRVVTLPMPGPVMADAEEPGGEDLRLPASYANFYIANNVVLLPVFGHANDQRAVDVLQPLFPGRRVVPINCEPLVWGMGAIHCVSQQQPAPVR
jgi:agmatine deiminase